MAAGRRRVAAAGGDSPSRRSQSNPVTSPTSHAVHDSRESPDRYRRLAPKPLDGRRRRHNLVFQPRSKPRRSPRLPRTLEEPMIKRSVGVTLALLFLLVASSPLALPGTIPAGSKLAYNFNMIGYP